MLPPVSAYADVAPASTNRAHSTQRFPMRRAYRGSSRAQDDARDLERREQPHRRTPVAAAARDVQLRALVVVAAGQEAALLELDDVVPRPDLAAVRVARELE